MIGLLVELIVSWLMLRYFQGKNLSVLGVAPDKNRLGNLFFGFLIAAFCCTVYYVAFAALTNSKWTLNSPYTSRTFAVNSWWTLNSLLFEEFIFRGALLYIAIQRFGTKTACIISAIAFGVYHWFSMGALGNPMQMIFIFFMTGVWGFMFAMAFAKTQSLYLPVGLHFGWNLVYTVVFSQGPLGNQLLISNGGQKMEDPLSLVFFLFQVFAVPLITYWYLRRQSKTTVSHMSTISTDRFQK